MRIEVHVGLAGLAKVRGRETMELGMMGKAE
jgi:hypothetical protein